MRTLKVLIVLLLFPIAILAQEDEELISKSRIKDKYTITSIDETKRFYLYNAENSKNEEVLLVVDKESKQLKCKKIKIGKKYKFNTYSFLDLVHVNANLSHYVDGKKVWSYKDKVDLRFTDSMGNDVEIEE